MEYRKRFELRFGDLDLAGVLHYPRLYGYLHETMEEFFREAYGRHYADVFQEDGIGYPTVRVETEFRDTLKYGDAVDVVVTIPRLGGRSVTWRYRVFREGEEAPRAEARITTACVDMATWRTRDLPPDHRAVLERYGEE
jgi:YbgC/YbaW family acyl-CoA thioester hydrolase